MQQHREILAGIGAIRTAIGASLVAAPALGGRMLVGDDDPGPGTRVFARIVGARDVALGLAQLHAAWRGDARAASLAARSGVLADAADATATLLAARQVEGARRWLTPLIAAVFGGIGVLAWNAVEDPSAADRNDEVESSAERAGIVDQQDAVAARMAEV